MGYLDCINHGKLFLQNARLNRMWRTRVALTFLSIANAINQNGQKTLFLLLFIKKNIFLSLVKNPQKIFPAHI